MFWERIKKEENIDFLEFTAKDEQEEGNKYIYNNPIHLIYQINSLNYKIFKIN